MTHLASCGQSSKCRLFSCGFTLIELLVVVAIIGILAGLLFPALARSAGQARQTHCVGQLRQIGLAFNMYLSDHGEKFPDRRDLKASLGYKPWADWPPSDPRGGWAGVVLRKELQDEVWKCAGRKGAAWKSLAAGSQLSRTNEPSSAVDFWLWRFDRFEDPVPLDNFWNKSLEQSARDYASSRISAGEIVSGESEVELAVDAYFPSTISALPAEIKGLAPHPGGRNRLFLDGHAGFSKDNRLRSR